MLDEAISWGQIKTPLTILNIWKWLYVKALVLLLSLPNTIVWSHIVGDKATTVELKKLCEFAYTCFHDTVIICGKSVNEARTFLDLCDMYEFSCEYNIDTLWKKMVCAQIQKKYWDKETFNQLQT